MKNPFKRNQKKQSKFYINNKEIIITPLSYKDLMEVVFLILPYLKLVKVVKDEKKSSVTADVFFDVINSLIGQLSRTDLNKALQLLLRKDEEFVSQIETKDLLTMLPLIIKENNLIDVFFLLRNLGAFE